MSLFSFFLSWLIPVLSFCIFRIYLTWHFTLLFFLLPYKYCIRSSMFANICQVLSVILSIKLMRIQSIGPAKLTPEAFKKSKNSLLFPLTVDKMTCKGPFQPKSFHESVSLWNPWTFFDLIMYLFILHWKIYAVWLHHVPDRSWDFLFLHHTFLYNFIGIGTIRIFSLDKMVISKNPTVEDLS